MERLLSARGRPPVKPDTALSDLSFLRAFHIDSRMPDEVFDSHSKHFRRMIDGARRLHPYRPKLDLRPISRLAVAKVSQIVSGLPLQSPSPLTNPQLDELNMAVASREAFASFLRIGEFT
jgi:hypothetical protein